MRQTFTLHQKQKTELAQILKELNFSIKKTFEKEDFSSFALILKESGKQTFKSKKKATAKILKSVGKFSIKSLSFTYKKIRLYTLNGFQKEFKKDLKQTKNVLCNTPNKIVAFGKHLKNNALSFNENFFKKTKDEKVELISVGLMGILIFFASAGGKDIEGGIPDLDLKLGIGYHRHCISHSIIMGVLVEILMRTGIPLRNK